jgi:GH15 family glucan-1,4-alpha-glucosidase
LRDTSQLKQWIWIEKDTALESVKYQPIENHGVVGDLYTVALIGMDGSIDFMCFPNFDSPTIFARLLDAEKGGSFQLAPVMDGAGQKQLYLPDTNILLTRFLSTAGVAEISDFMPVEKKQPFHDLVRRAKTVRGEIRYRMFCKPAFDYARATHRVYLEDNQAIFKSDGPLKLHLRLISDQPLSLMNDAVVSEFTLTTGETATFVLEEHLPGSQSPASSPDFASESFKETMDYWHQWTRQCRYQGRWREMVQRSALTLKLLTSWRYGSMVAAPTFGLPEHIGGERNWDYRYSWVRDASFTLYALIRLGYTEEADHFMRWLEGLSIEAGPHGLMQTMYALDGSRDLTEIVLPHLEGYRGSVPVRIGNGAYDQLQLDIYGELLDSVYLFDKYGSALSYDLWRKLVPMLNWVCEHWEQPDQGIWEVRGEQKHFLYSRILCWVALDRGIRLARKRSLPGPINRWMASRDTIYQDVYKNFWNEERKAFGQFKGSQEVDASSLVMPLVRFISPKDPRFLSHLKVIEQDLVEDSTVYRYRIGRAADDGLRGDEGSFSMCSFWYVEALSRAGELKKARLLFEKMLGYANHLGLYAEELGPMGEHLGNFPQAFTHLALISAAYDLDRRLTFANVDS